MTTATLPTDGHLDDGVLLQLLDGEPQFGDGAKHLEACAQCSGRLAELRSASATAHRAIADVRIPDRALRLPRRRPRWIASFPMAAAATGVLLISAAAAAPPVRSWLLRQLSTPAEGPATPAVVSSPPAAPRSGAAGIIASFVPADTVLVIRIDRRQPTGTLELSSASGDRVSAQPAGPTQAEELLVTPSGIRVVNGTSSAADYRVRVPAAIRVIRVLIADRAPMVIRNGASLDRRIGLSR